MDFQFALASRAEKRSAAKSCDSEVLSLCVCQSCATCENQWHCHQIFVASSSNYFWNIVWAFFECFVTVDTLTYWSNRNFAPRVQTTVANINELQYVNSISGRTGMILVQITQSHDVLNSKSLSLFVHMTSCHQISCFLFNYGIKSWVMNPRTSSHQTYTFEPEVHRCWILPHWPCGDILEWASQGWLDDTCKSRRVIQSPSFTLTALEIGFAVFARIEVKKTSLVRMPVRKCWNFEGFKDQFDMDTMG